MDQNQISAQMEMFGYTAEGAQQEADKFVGEAGNLEEDISKAASFIVPFYDSGVNIANVAQEYMKPEQERDYDYIKSQFTEAGQSAAIEGGLLLMGGVAGKYGAKGIKALADKVKQYEIDPTAMSAFGAGAIRKKQRFTLDDFGYKEDNPVTEGVGKSAEDWLSENIEYANKSKNLLDGATTAFLGTNKDKPLFLDTDLVSSLKGARDEVRKKGDPQYDRLKETVDKEGFDPNQTILIEVNHKGEAYIVEGNTRAALAKELDVPNIKAEIRYKNGAELVDSPFSPQNIIEKSSKISYPEALAISKKFDDVNVPTIEAAGLTDEAIETWRSKNETPKEFRDSLKGRNPELQAQAKRLGIAQKFEQGVGGRVASGISNVVRDTYRKLADELRPIRKVNKVPKPATNKEIVSALNSRQRTSPIIGLNHEILEKDIVDVRLNIPAYTDYDVWIPTITHNKKEKYKAAVRIQNVKFIQPDSSGVRKAQRVAQGGEKSPFAVMTGEYVEGTDDELFTMSKEVFDSSEWTQVGYDPIKRGFFYDRETGQAILEADEVIQVGHLVLAKNAKKSDPDVFPFNKGGVAMNEQMEMAFMQQGGIKDDGMNKDPVSGNPIPPGSMASEVRDDIPAMLSEGEYVVPADVLRFYGVNFFEDLRNKAKSGLQNMEKNGRIGGEPLSQQQVQQNMGNVPVQANTGILAGQNTGTVGFSTMQPAGSDAPSVTTFKTWVHAQTGEQKIIEYINGKPKTEEPESPPFYEFGSASLKKAQTQIKVDDDNDDPKTTEKPDPNAWMDGIDFSDASAMNAKVDEVLGLSMGEKGTLGAAGMVAGLPGMAIGKTLVDGNSISTARALELYTRNSLKDTNTADKMKSKIDDALEKNKILGWLDKSFPGLMPGTQRYESIINKVGDLTSTTTTTPYVAQTPEGQAAVDAIVREGADRDPSDKIAAKVGSDAGDGMVWVVGDNTNAFVRVRPDDPKAKGQVAALQGYEE